MTRKPVRFTTSKGRGSFELDKDTSDELYNKVKRLAQLCGKSIRKGVVIDDVDKAAIKNLPPDILNQFIANELWDGVSTKKIPTLSEFLDDAIPVSTNPKTQTKREQYRRYLLEYHGNKRVDLIGDIEAKGIIIYFTKDRKEKTGRRCLKQYPVARAITAWRSYFEVGVERGYFAKNPYRVKNVSLPKTPDKARRKFIAKEVVQSITDKTKDVELRCLIGFHRHCGIRGESEWHELRYSDIKFEKDGTGSVRIPLEGKTGERIIPIFDDFRPYFVALVAAAFPGQDFDAVAAAGFPGKEFVFERLRTHSNVRTPIRKAMKRAGLKPEEFPSFPTNCRRSFIKDKIEEGFNEEQITSMVGNSAEVRKAYYSLGRTRTEIAGWSLRSSGSVHVPVPSLQKSVPQSAPLLVLQRRWTELFDDGTSEVEIVYQMLVMAGWSEKRAREIAENDKAAMTVVKDLKRCRERFTDYRAGRISWIEYIVSHLGPAFRELWGRIAMNPICLALTDLEFTEKRVEKLLMGGVGLEPTT